MSRDRRSFLRALTEAVSKIKIVGERYTGTQAQQTSR